MKSPYIHNITKALQSALFMLYTVPLQHYLRCCEALFAALRGILFYLFDRELDILCLYRTLLLLLPDKLSTATVLHPPYNTVYMGTSETLIGQS